MEFKLKRGKRSKRDFAVLASLFVLMILSFIFFDKLSIPKLKILDILFAPFKEIYSYISLFILLALALSFLNRKYKSNLKREAMALAITLALGFLIKFSIRRERPSEGFYLSSSFPSNHSSMPFSLLAFFKNWFFAAWLLISLIVALSRVYFGYHYFSDIFAGAFIGYLVGFLVNRLVKAKK